MKSKKFFWVFVALLMALMSCKRENPFTDNNPSNEGGSANIEIKDLVVPADFDFESEKELTVRVKVTYASHAGERFVIKLYNNVPATGELITTGITDANGEYTTKLRLPAWEEFLYIEKVNEDGTSNYEKVKANQFVTATMNNGNPTNVYTMRKTSSGLNCNTGCTKTLNNNTSWVTVNKNEVVCFTGTVGGGITVKNGGNARICGNGSFSLTIQNKGKAYILENAIVNLNNINTNGSKPEFYNYSDSVTTSGSMSINGIIRNHGKIDINGDLNINSNGDVKNYGTLNIKTNFNINKDFKNYHFITVGNTMNNNSNADFENFCYLKVENDLNNNGDLWTNCYIKVLDKFTNNSSGDVELDNGALLSTKNLTVNKDIEGKGSNTSRIKVTDNTTINSNGKIKGKINLCDANGVENLWGQIQSPATQSCAGYIAPSTCNPEGFGTPPVQDADNDGVPDGQDEYPNDPDRAFNSYYPSATKTATLAFEDLWPAQGDFDYNDLTLAFNIHKILNADNEVVDFNVKMKVRSVGASFENGFGWQFDEVVPADVNSVTGQLLTKNLITRSSNGTEANQAKAVIIAYDSPEPSMTRATGSMFNTIKANPKGSSDTIRIKVNFKNPVADTKMGIEKFNPFIFSDQKRGNEIHLGNFKPTDLVTQSLFGTQDDASNSSAGIYYKTANGLPWAILIPEDFDYPQERTAITEAYHNFDDWATSGGVNNTNWYTNAAGNRDITKLFEVLGLL
jgi:LruC domain-containing protein